MCNMYKQIMRTIIGFILCIIIVCPNDTEYVPKGKDPYGMKG